MIAAAIVACEVGFWTLLFGGLAARYVLGRQRLGAVLLVGVPLVDLMLLAVTAVDLAGGAVADWSHGLAAVYLGFSVVFGPSLVRAADVRFARRFAGGPAPRPPRPEDRLAAHWRLWLRCVLACGVAAVVLAALVLVAGGPERTRALWEGGGWFAQLGAVCALWLLLGPLWTAVAQFLRRRPSFGD